jgi:hypothetical protein
MSADGAGRLLVAYQVPIEATERHPKKYRIYNGGAWSGEYLVGDERKSSTFSAGGGAGAFYMGYMVPGVDVGISRIPPGSVQVELPASTLASSDIDLGAQFLVEATDTAHVVWESGHKLAADPGYHPAGVFYDHRAGGAWVEGASGTRLACASLFGNGSLNNEEQVMVHVAVSPSGTKLVVFTSMDKLYYVVQANGSWGPLRYAAMGVGARWSHAMALGSGGRFLVVWSTSNSAGGTLYYTIMDV